MKNKNIILFTILISLTAIVFPSEKTGCAQFSAIFNEAKAQAQVNDGLGQASGIVHRNHAPDAFHDNKDSLFHTCRKDWLRNPENQGYGSNSYGLTSIGEHGLQHDDFVELDVLVYESSWSIIKKQLKKKLKEFIN